MSAGCPIAVHDISGLAVEFCEILDPLYRREIRGGRAGSKKKLSWFLRWPGCDRLLNRREGTTWRGDLSRAQQLSYTFSEAICMRTLPPETTVDYVKVRDKWCGPLYNEPRVRNGRSAGAIRLPNITNTLFPFDLWPWTPSESSL